MEKNIDFLRGPEMLTIFDIYEAAFTNKIQQTMNLAGASVACRLHAICVYVLVLHSTFHCDH